MFHQPGEPVPASRRVCLSGCRYHPPDRVDRLFCGQDRSESAPNRTGAYSKAGADATQTRDEWTIPCIVEAQCCSSATTWFKTDVARAPIVS
jgi:hypothetical protein